MKTILLVEDDTKYRKILRDTLTEEGYSVLEAQNGKVGLEVAEKNTIDLILLDLLMPEVDGVSFYYKLKNILKKQIPIIVLTNLMDATGYDSNIKEVLIKANTSLDKVTEKVKKYLS